jgi:hypothetical protein
MKRENKIRWLALAGAALLLAGAVRPLRAQDPDDSKRGVARISLINGEVSVRRGDAGEWVAGVVNAPLLAGDSISTAPNSRAEVQFDSANILRIGGNAEVRLSELEYGRFQMDLARGTVTYRVLRSSNANVELDTPSVSVRPARVGAYRVSVNDAGETEVIARAGEVEVFTPRGSQWVSSGQSMIARGTSADPEFQIVRAMGTDDWDRWNDGRDQALTRSVSPQYVGEGVYGAEDLDQYGSWSNVEPYGYCWRPRVAAGWAPYHYGRWTWADWYGWTWVSDDPWGWAPYHYGRWFYEPAFGWGWYPGGRGMRHYWSPALVGWFGFGGGGGVGFGFGNVGWVPLAPYETYRPWWGRGYYGRGYMNNSVNITNVNITNVYRNARVNNGISSIGTNDFRGGRFNAIQHASGDQVRQAGLVRGQMPIGPTDAHLNYTGRQAAFVPRTNDNGRFFRQQQPSAANRIPFAQQRGDGGMGQRGNGMPAQGNVAGPRGSGAQGGPARGIPAAQAQGNAMSPRSGAAEQGQGGWRRAGEAATPGNARGAAPGTGESQSSPAMRNDRPSGNSPRGGWSRFGDSGGQNAAPRAGESQQSSPAVRNDRPSNNSPRGGFGRFGEPGGGSNNPPQAQSQAPRSEFRSSPYAGSAQRDNSGSRSMRIEPPVVSQRPSYSAPQSYSSGRQSYGGGSGGGNSGPRSMGSSRPSSGGGGGGGAASRPSSGGGGGGGRPSGGGGGGGNRGHR